jgi:photosystem II stability/assembly factor-like uncharacterized protein
MTLVRIHPCSVRRLLVPVAALALLAGPLAASTQAHGAKPSLDHARKVLAEHGKAAAWTDVGTGIDEQYRGLDAVNRRVAWVSGENGSVLRTTNGGKSWKDVSPAGSTGMAFRDIEARGAWHASVLAIGSGEDSRIYTTDNGGKSWSLAFVNDDPNAFYDCMAFWPGDRNGIAMSDPVDGKFRIIRTRDGGHSWHVVSSAGMPAAEDGEFGFAASGTCLVATGQRSAYLASGGSAARIFRSHDRGRHWRVADSKIPPVVDAGGVFSIAFKNPRVGIAVGGDYTNETNPTVSSLSRSYGRIFHARGETLGYRSGVAWVNPDWPFAVAVGPTGTDVSPDAGGHWYHIDATAYDGVQCTRDGSCWTSGPHGAVGRVTF